MPGLGPPALRDAPGSPSGRPPLWALLVAPPRGAGRRRPHGRGGRAGGRAPARPRPCGRPSSLEAEEEDAEVTTSASSLPTPSREGVEPGRARGSGRPPACRAARAPGKCGPGPAPGRRHGCWCWCFPPFSPSVSVLLLSVCTPPSLFWQMMVLRVGEAGQARGCAERWGRPDPLNRAPAPVGPSLRLLLGLPSCLSCSQSWCGSSETPTRLCLGGGRGRHGGRPGGAPRPRGACLAPAAPLPPAEPPGRGPGGPPPPLAARSASPRCWSASSRQHAEGACPPPRPRLPRRRAGPGPRAGVGPGPGCALHLPPPAPRGAARRRPAG